MHNFTEKNVQDNILAGGNAWVKWKCVSCEMHEPWHHRRILQQIGGGKLRQSPKGRGGVRVIGEGAVSSLPTKQEVWGLRGSTVNSLSRVRGRAPAAKRFFLHFSTQDGLSWHFSGVNHLILEASLCQIQEHDSFINNNISAAPSLECATVVSFPE